MQCLHSLLLTSEGVGFTLGHSSMGQLTQDPMSKWGRTSDMLDFFDKAGLKEISDCKYTQDSTNESECTGVCLFCKAYHLSDQGTFTPVGAQGGS